MILILEHGYEIVEFDYEKLVNVLGNYGWDSVDEFVKKSDFNQREAIINYESQTIHDMYRKEKRPIYKLVEEK